MQTLFSVAGVGIPLWGIVVGSSSCCCCCCAAAVAAAVFRSRRRRKRTSSQWQGGGTEPVEPVVLTRASSQKVSVVIQADKSGAEEETRQAMLARLALLPLGWEEHFDEHGTPFYFHIESGKTQWHPPEQSDRTMDMEEEEEEEEEPQAQPSAEAPSVAEADETCEARRRKSMDALATMVAPSVDQHTATIQQQAEEAMAMQRRAVVEAEFDECETAAILEYVNATLRDDPHVQALLPTTAEMGDGARWIFAAVSQSVLFSKLIAHTDPDALDPRALNLSDEADAALSRESRMQNHTLCCNALASIGCGLPHLRAEQLEASSEEANHQVALQLLWNLMRHELVTPLVPRSDARYLRLTLPNEEVSAMAKLLPEQTMLRWVNHHLRAYLSSPSYLALPHERRPLPAGHAVGNLDMDLADGKALIVLLHQIAPPHAPVDLSALDAPTSEQCATAVLMHAARVGARRVKLMPGDITTPRPRLLLALVAELMALLPALEPVVDIDLSSLMDGEEGSKVDAREERTYRMWITSLGIDLESSDLFEDCRTGLPLLRIEDHLQPGIIDWARVHQRPKHIYERVENCNIAIEVARRLKMTVVGIDGNDVAQGSRKLTLAILWQLMRADLLAFLATLGISDNDVIRWANKCVRESGSQLQIRKPSDVTLRNGVFLLQLEHAVAPECVAAEEILDGSAAVECKL